MALLTGTRTLSLVNMVKGAVPPVKTKGMLVVQSLVVRDAGVIDGGMPVCPLPRTVTLIVTNLPAESTTAIFGGGLLVVDMPLMVSVVPLTVVVTRLVLLLVAA